MNLHMKYIDIHTHILPGVDDGSESMEETIKMLQIAAQQQIMTIIATPHYAAGGNNLPVEQLMRVRDQVQKEAYKIHKDFKILLGNELFYSESILDALKSGEALTLADSRYILVEFSIRASYNTIYYGMSELIRSGYMPILAHVERYLCLRKRVDLVNELTKLGCYIQMNCSSLKGGFFNSEAATNRKLLSYGLVHFIGSDCHSAQLRVPMMDTTIKYLQKKFDDRLMNQIFVDNPVKLLENIYI